MIERIQEQPDANDYLGPDNTELSAPEQIQAVVSAAAVRPETTGQPDAGTEARRQMGIAAADRKNREAAGLPPRVYDLR